MKREHSSRRIIGIVGAYPPPVHGASKNLATFADEIESISPIIRINTSPGTLKRGFFYHLKKIVSVANALISIATNRPSVIYIVPDGGHGALYSLLIILLARSLGATFYIHHRSFGYLTKPSWAMKRIASVTEGEFHIFLCQGMRDLYQNVYGKPSSDLILSNIGRVPSLLCEASTKWIGRAPSTLTVGHLSNLSIEKGLGVVIETVERLIASGLEGVQLLLAGPCSDDKAEAILQSALKRLKGNISYLGPIYGEEKMIFFERSDVFLFPSTYTNEAQPNVVFEAACAGSIPITTPHSCMATDTLKIHGEVVGIQNFVEQAAIKISSLAKSEQDLLNRRTLVSKSAIALRGATIAEQDRLVSLIARGT